MAMAAGSTKSSLPTFHFFSSRVPTHVLNAGIAAGRKQTNGQLFVRFIVLVLLSFIDLASIIIYIIMLDAKCGKNR